MVQPSARSSSRFVLLCSLSLVACQSIAGLEEKELFTEPTAGAAGAGGAGAGGSLAGGSAGLSSGAAGSEAGGESGSSQVGPGGQGGAGEAGEGGAAGSAGDAGSAGSAGESGAAGGASGAGGGGGPQGGEGGGGQGGGGQGGGGQGGAVCAAGSSQACYDGPPDTKGVGSCKEGTQTCSGEGGYGPCDKQVLPEPVDDCEKKVDADCNGKVCGAVDKATRLWGTSGFRPLVAVADNKRVFTAMSLGVVNVQDDQGNTYCDDPSMWAIAGHNADNITSLDWMVCLEGTLMTRVSALLAVSPSQFVVSGYSGSGGDMALTQQWLDPDKKKLRVDMPGGSDKERGFVAMISVDHDGFASVDWLVQIGLKATTGYPYFRASDLALNKDGDVLVTGSYSGTPAADNGLKLPDAGADPEDGFVSLLRAQDGTNLWTTILHGDGSENVQSIFVEPTSGELLVSLNSSEKGTSVSLGSWTSAIDKGKLTAVGWLSPAGDALPDRFVLLKGEGERIVSDAIVLSDGSLRIGGYFSGTLEAGSTPKPKQTVQSSFVAALPKDEKAFNPTWVTYVVTDEQFADLSPPISLLGGPADHVYVSLQAPNDWKIVSSGVNKAFSATEQSGVLLRLDGKGKAVIAKMFDSDTDGSAAPPTFDDLGNLAFWKDNLVVVGTFARPRLVLDETHQIMSEGSADEHSFLATFAW